MRYLVVQDFDRLQHYRDRAPRWIKLYAAILDDYRYAALTDAARSHLVGLWILASRHDNRIPYDARYIARAIQASSRVNPEALITAGFLAVVDDAAADASDLLAEPERPASGNGARPERSASLEGEREIEREQKKSEKRTNTRGAIVETDG